MPDYSPSANGGMPLTLPLPDYATGNRKSKESIQLEMKAEILGRS
jgi:hypothetical protein